MEFVYSDGGRSKYFKANNVGDCVTRAIANATGMDYKDVYDMVNQASKGEKKSKKKRGKSSARDGVYKDVSREVLKQLGWVWHPTMKVGQGCKTHLKADELPSGTIIVSVSKHLTCVKDGVIYDTYDCSRDGTRCVYGYWKRVKEEDITRVERRCNEAYYRITAGAKSIVIDKNGVRAKR